MARRIFIGDLQGCREEFEQLLEVLKFDPSSDRLLPVGDLVNRGPDSLGCLRLARSLGAEPVLGNHDVHLLRQASDPGLRGNRSTLDSLRAADDGEELLRWLGSLPIARGWDDALMVHAGIHPSWAEPLDALSGRDPLDRSDQAVEFAVRVRYCDALGQQPTGGDWPPPPEPFYPWDALWRLRRDEHRTVVFGHWARRGLVVEERTRGIDTGCVYGGSLTAWIPEENRLVSVPARQRWHGAAG